MIVDTPIRNAKLLPDGRYDCEIQHPSLGWIPFTASQVDVEVHGRYIWLAINKLLSE